MPEAGDSTRIITLDVIRGVAVMGILAMNIVGFALPEAAYFNPWLAGADSPGDRLSWFVSFVLIDGKMRGLFSFLFGASMLLVIERADAAGEPSARLHISRMAWLLVFGLAHFYLIWWGDILSLYAVIGSIAWFFAYRAPATLLRYGILLILAQTAIEAQQIAGPLNSFGPEDVTASLAFYQGTFWDIASYRIGADPARPLIQIILIAWETLGYMLLGMAALKAGFLTGAWSKRSYAAIAVLGFAIAVPIYLYAGWAQVRAGFSAPSVQLWNNAVTAPVRPIMVAGWAALIILLSAGGGPLARRFAATGRAAFTNYLGTSLAMTGLFYGWGLGLFGELGRLELWLIVLAAWAVMLLWSKPWLERYRYGPFEWLWRSLARGQPQPMIRR